MNRFFSTIVNKNPLRLLNITENAWYKMTNILKKTNDKNNIGFLFSADSGGCNGFNYNLELINNTQFKELKNPSIIENNNIKLIIDPFSEFYLLGTTIDYINEDFNKGIFENKFLFIPDQKTAYSCGCGKSFTLK